MAEADLARATARRPRDADRDGHGRARRAAPLPPRGGRRRSLADLPRAPGRELPGPSAVSSGARRLAGRRVDRAHLRPRLPLSRSARRAGARPRPPRRRLVRRLDRRGGGHHGLASARVADPHRSGGNQGRRLDLPVPLRHGHPGAGGHGLPQSGGGAGPDAPRPERGHPARAGARADGHRPRLVEPVPLQSAPAPAARPHPSAHPALLGRARPPGPAGLRQDLAGRNPRRHPPRLREVGPRPPPRRTRRRRHRDCRILPRAHRADRQPADAATRTHRSPPSLQAEHRAPFNRPRAPFNEVLLLPPDAVPDGSRRAVVVGDALQSPLRSRRRPHPLQPVPRRAGVRGAARLGRHLRERAPPELLRHHAEPQRHGGHARAPDQPGQDRHSRQRPAPAREPAAHRRGDRHAGRRLRRARDLGLRARHLRRVLLHRRQSHPLARALLRGGRADPAARGRKRAPSPSTGASTAIPT